MNSRRQSVGRVESGRHEVDTGVGCLPSRSLKGAHQPKSVVSDLHRYPESVSAYSVALPAERPTCYWFGPARHMSNTMFKPGGLILRGSSISVFQGGGFGHLLRRLAIVISCSVGGSEAY